MHLTVNAVHVTIDMERHPRNEVKLWHLCQCAH